MLVSLIIAYLILTLAIGIYASRKVTKAEDFALAGRQLPFHLSLSSFFATWFGAETILGVSSQFAQHGFIGITEDPLGASLCLFLTGLFFVKYFYNKGHLSIGDYFKERYGARFELTASLVQALSYFTYTSAQFVALGLVLETVTHFSFSACLIISSSIVIIYTFLGGMWAIAITDFIQSIVIVVGLLALTFFLWNKWEDPISIESLIPEQGFHPFPNNNFKGWATYFTAWIVMGFGSIPSQDIFQRVMSANSERVARTSAIWAGAIYLLASFLPILIVMFCIRMYSGQFEIDSQQIIPMMVLRHAPIAIQALFFGALLSAILSTASASILAQATVISENLIKPRFKSISEKKFLLVLRMTLLAVSLISILISLKVNSIFFLASSSSCVVLVSLFIPMTGGILFPKASAFSAQLSLTLGLLTYGVLTWYEFELLAAFFGFFASIIGFFLPVIYHTFKATHNFE